MKKIFLLAALASLGVVSVASADVGVYTSNQSTLLANENLYYGNTNGGNGRLLKLQVGLLPRFQIDLAGNILASGTAEFVGDVTANAFKVRSGATTINVCLQDGTNCPASVGPSGTAGGDLSGTYPNPTVDGLQGRTVANTAPTNGQVLKWNGTTWAPAIDDGSAYTAGANLTLTGTQFAVRNDPTFAGIVTINNSLRNANGAIWYIDGNDGIQLRINANGGSGEFGVNNSNNTRVLTLNNSGNLTVTGGVSVGGNTTIGGTATVASNLSVGGQLTLTGVGGLTVPTGNTNLNHLSVAGTIYNPTAAAVAFQDDVSVSGRVSIGTNLAVFGTITSGGQNVCLQNGTNCPVAGGNPTGAAGGDLSGMYPNPVVAKLQGRTVVNTAPTSGQVLQWNGSGWAPATMTSVTGNGTNGYLPKYSSANTIENSALSQNASGNIGIGSGNPTQKLDVNGNIAATKAIINDYYVSSVDGDYNSAPIYGIGRSDLTVGGSPAGHGAVQVGGYYGITFTTNGSNPNLIIAPGGSLTNPADAMWYINGNNGIQLRMNADASGTNGEFKINNRTNTEVLRIRDAGDDGGLVDWKALVFTTTGNVTVGANLSVDGDIGASDNVPEACVWTGWTTGGAVCPDGKFMAGVDIQQVGNAGGQQEQRVYCCEL